jgi:hypothetical protein
MNRILFVALIVSVMLYFILSYFADKKKKLKKEAARNG